MKTTLFVIFFIITILAPAKAQNDFKVIKVNGTILLRDRGVSLETGTVFSEKENLLFRSDDATAAVINPQHGRVVITSKSHDLATSRSNYLPSMYNISSRGSSLSKSSDLANYFSGKFVVIERESVKIDDSTFPMDSEHFFFLRYLYKGDEINKKLNYSGDSLIIDKNTLFTVDGSPIPSTENTSIKLFYRKGNESVFISQFDLIFPDMKQLFKETEVILSEISSKSPAEKLSEIGSYINEFYGKIAPEHLSGWLEKRFGIR